MTMPTNIHRDRLAPMAAELIAEVVEVVEELVALHDRADAIEAQAHHDRDETRDLRERISRLEIILCARVPQ